MGNSEPEWILGERTKNHGDKILIEFLQKEKQTLKRLAKNMKIVQVIKNSCKGKKWGYVIGIMRLGM